MRHIMKFYRFNSEARKKYLEAFEKLAWEKVLEDRGASFRSMGEVFLHVLEAYRYWFNYVIRGEPQKERRLESFRDVGDMREFEHEVDSMVMKAVGDLREEDLTKVYSYSPNDNSDQSVQVSMEAILLHMIEEELQHRGEINCMLWQQDIDPPITEYHRWLEESN